LFSPRSPSVARALPATAADDNVVADDDYDDDDYGDDDDDDNAATSVFPRTLFATPPSAAPARADTVPPGSGSWRARYRRRRHRPVARAAFATRLLTGVSHICRHCRRSRHYRHGRRTRLTAGHALLCVFLFCNDEIIVIEVSG